jgi:preprotein translocase subunit YajC
MCNINLILIIVIVIIIIYFLYSNSNKIEQFTTNCNSIKNGSCVSSLCPSDCKIISIGDDNCKCIDKT